MPLTYEDWPFRHMRARSAEETWRWWEGCYISPDASLILGGGPHWLVVAGGTGSGKSVAIADLEGREAQTSLIVRYPAERWPGAKQAWVPDGNHLAQIMAGAGLALRNYLVAQPSIIGGLSNVQRGFLRWLLTKYGGPRAYLRWVDGLEPSLAETFQGLAYEELYPSTTNPLDMQGQIDELASMARKLGFHRVLVTVDMDQHEAQAHLGQVESLFDLHDTMDHPGLVVAAALPAEAIQNARLIERARGRVTVVYLKWYAAQTREISIKHIRQALGNPSAEWGDFVSNNLLYELGEALVSEYGDNAPAGWVGLAESILHLASREVDPLPLPLQRWHLLDTKRALFARHMLLRLDPAGHGIWRGPKFIKLTGQPLRFLKILKERYPEPVNAEDKGLIAIAGNKDNIHTIASRTRALIEPFTDHPVYLHNRRGDGGYWLEALNINDK